MGILCITHKGISHKYC